MSVHEVERAVWRSFRPEFSAEAFAHVRAGGYAAVVDRSRGDDGPRVTLFVPLDEKGRLDELTRWALLSIDHRRWLRVKEGAAVGLGRATVRPEYVDAVLDWCDRDAAHPGSRRTMRLDCLECAACCRDANVVLGESDVHRWTKAGRRDLHGRTYLRRHDGKLTLRILDDGRCPHLADDRRCRIYELRPDNCRWFVVGSEACLAAREETLSLRDG